MKESVKDVVLSVTNGVDVGRIEHIQTLWSGYGEILRVFIEDGNVPSVILKSIVPPAAGQHPRGWNTSRSHSRKIKSYAVEMHWYRAWSQHCNAWCRVAKCLGVISSSGEQVIVLEDLNCAGFYIRKDVLTKQEVGICLAWLANFHATFLNEAPEGLWEVGTYWHLATRPDELAAMQSPELQQVAHEIDRELNSCRFQTIVHGDAKVANFCFAPEGQNVAAVDFQYVGGGCGMKDVAYFLGSCLNERQCEQWADELLEDYFWALALALKRLGKKEDIVVLQSEWRPLFPYAWADFQRFLLGWMPSHKKVNAYSSRLTSEVVSTLNNK